MALPHHLQPQEPARPLDGDAARGARHRARRRRVRRAGRDGGGLQPRAAIHRVDARTPSSCSAAPQGELTSGFSRDEANRILVDSRVARDAERRPLASPEIVVVGVLTRKDGNADVNVTIRGVTPMAFKVRSGRQDRRRARLPARALRDHRRAQAESAHAARRASATRSACRRRTGRSSASSRPTAAASRARSGATPR